MRVFVAAPSVLGLSQQRGILNPKPRIIECDVVVVADDDDLIPQSFFVLTVVFILPCRSDISDGTFYPSALH